MTTSTILITGGTGRTGRRVADRVAGHNPRITSRSGPTPFDWDDPDTWDAALDGCSAAYLCYSPDLALPGVDDIIKRFVSRAGALGVDRLVLLSGRGEDGARACEDIVLAATPTATVVRCSWFQENFSEHFLRGSVLAGRIAVPAGDVREPFVSLDDVADIAALALTSGGYDGQVLELTGPQSITFTEAADQLSRAIDRPISYESVDGETFVLEQVAAGVHPDEAGALAWLFDEVLDGRNVATTSTIEQVLGRPARSFADYARSAAAAGAWS
ncbi:NmrA family transcriptional regulator [Millisia brevis]|uniref:NmrA family transcriptional regulator n=1 Tax=Millisia brevis TaxID=264148 RepID=UPI000833ACCE|nr:NmrA family transcriptional regulator [Millisia brevis]